MKSPLVLNSDVGDFWYQHTECHMETLAYGSLVYLRLGDALLDHRHAAQDA